MEIPPYTDRLDTIDRTLDRATRRAQLTGNDWAPLLVDCAEMITFALLTIAEAIHAFGKERKE